MIGIDQIHARDEVTLEITDAVYGRYTVTGTVQKGVNEHDLMVGGLWLHGNNRQVIAHTPKYPEWWSWRLIRFNGHLFALDALGIKPVVCHVHGPSYCGCGTYGVRGLQHDSSTRTLTGIERVSFAVETDLLD